MVTCRQLPDVNRHPPACKKYQPIFSHYNEAEKIEAAISSVLWADEVVVVDSFSVDRTAQIARSLGARVVDVQFKGFGDLRNRAIEACNFDWIFSLDADERCTEAVRDEILALLAGSPPHEIYMVPRRSYMMGRWIRGSGWYPNFRQPQLFRKGSIRYTLEPVHEGFEVVGGRSVGTLRNAVWQFPFRNLEEVINKMNRYSTLGRNETRRQARLDGERIRPRRLVFHQALHLQDWDSSTAGPASLSRSEISKAHFTATRSAMKRHKPGSPHPASQSNAFLSAHLSVRACVQPSSSSNDQGQDRSRPLRRQAPLQFRGRPLGRGYSRRL